MKTLKQIYEANLTDIAGNNDKGTTHTYIEVYQELFCSYRDRPINFLEIGVAQGYSLSMWNKYFHTDSKVIGYDIKQHPLISDSLEVYYGDSRKAGGLEHIDEFDIIVDDGDHSPEGQLATATNWLSRVKNNGIYVIEDIYAIDINRYKKLLDSLNMSKSIISLIDLRINKRRYDDILMIIRVNK